jgi:phage terminase large subunit-like protein
MYYITTAGVSSENVGYSEHKYAKNVLRGIFKDDSYFAYISGMDEGDDPFVPATWEKVNPNYGVSVKPSAMAEAAAMAEKRPGLLNEFLRYRLNAWTSQSRRWISTDKWDLCPSAVAPNLLLGQQCYLGIDLANTTDIAAAAWVFPPSGARRTYSILMKYWVPEERMLDRVRVDRVPYDVWARSGHVTVTPGSVIDYDRVRRDIVEFSQLFVLKEAGFDPWNATQIATQLGGDGFTMVEVRQGYRTLSEPTKFFEGLVLEKAVDHGGDPVLRWMISNVEVSTDEAGNIKPAKNKSTEKIDGVVAVITALSRMVAQTEDRREFKLVVL